MFSQPVVEVEVGVKEKVKVKLNLKVKVKAKLISADLHVAGVPVPRSGGRLHLLGGGVPERCLANPPRGNKSTSPGGCASTPARGPGEVLNPSWEWCRSACARPGQNPAPYSEMAPVGPRAARGESLVRSYLKRVYNPRPANPQEAPGSGILRQRGI